MPDEKKTEEGLPILSKPTNSQTEEGLPILKKKALDEPENLASPSSAPSVSEGGTSGLEVGASVPQNTPQTPPQQIDYLKGSNVLDKNFQQPQQPAAINSVPQTDQGNTVSALKPGANFNPFQNGPSSTVQKTALGNKLPTSNSMLSVNTSPESKIGFNADTQVSSNEKLIKQDQETKNIIDDYDNFSKTKGTGDDRTDAVDFYLDHIQRTDPEEYKYMKDKESSLIMDKIEHKGNPEDEKEDDLMLQKHQADILTKALSLKTKIAGGKYQIANNVIKDNYQDSVDKFNDLNQNIDDTKKQIDAADQQINALPKDQNGQPIMDPTNRKQIQTLIQSRTDLTTQMQGYINESNQMNQDPDLRDAFSLVGETEKNYRDLSKFYMELKNHNPKAYESMPELQKELVKEKDIQEKKDFIEKVTGGDAGVGEAVGRGVSGLAEKASFIPKMFSDITSLGDGYGFTDKWHDEAKSNIDDFDALQNPLPTGYDKPVYDSEKGEWNLRYLPGKVAGTLVEMAPIIAITLATEGATSSLLARAAQSRNAGLLASGASSEDIAVEMAGLLSKQAQTQNMSTYAGAFAGEYTAVASDYYNQAKEAGISEKDAVEFSQRTATMQAVLGAAFPDVKLMRSGTAKASLKTYVDAIANGASKKAAMAEGLKHFGANLSKELVQENLQTYAEIKDYNDLYQKIGLNDKIKDSMKNDIVETTVISTIVTGLLGINGFKTASSMNKEALFMAASQPDKIMVMARKMRMNNQLSDEQYNNFESQVGLASQALSKMDNTLPAEKKIEALGPLMEKMSTQESEKNLDDTQKKGSKEKVQSLDKEIESIVEAPSSEEVQDKNYVDEFEKHLDDEAAKEKEKASKTVDIPLTEKNKAKPLPTFEGIEAQISALEKELDDNNKSLQDKNIDAVEHGKNEVAINEEMSSLKKKRDNILNITAGDTSSKPAEITSTEKVEPVAEKTNIKTEEETPAVTEKGKMTPDNKSLVDEEEQRDELAAKNDNKETVRKMENDIEALKALNPDKQNDKTKEHLVDAKYKGMVGRAYAAYKNGEIARSTYIEFRNRTNDVYKAKHGGKELEVGAQVAAMQEQIKKKLFGEGYDKVSLMESDTDPKSKVNKIVDLVSSMVERGINKGLDKKIATQKALDFIRNHDDFKPYFDNKIINQRPLFDTIRDHFDKMEPDIMENVEKQQEEKKQSEKENTENTEESEPSNKKEVKELLPDVQSYTEKIEADKEHSIADFSKNFKSNNPFVNMVFNAIKDTADKIGIKIEFTNDLEKVNTGAVAKFDALTDKVIINLQAAKESYDNYLAGKKRGGGELNNIKGVKSFEDFVSYVATHELLHSVTEKVYRDVFVNTRKGVYTGNLNTTQVDAVNAIGKIFKHLQSLDIDTTFGGKEYGLHNMSELMAEMSNEEFVNKLRGIEVPEELRYDTKNKNVFDNIMTYLYEMITGKKFSSKDNAADNLLKAISDIVTSHEVTGNPETQSATEKKHENAPQSENFSIGETNRKASMERLRNNPEYKKLLDAINESDGIYDVTNKKKLTAFVNNVISEAEKSGDLVNLGEELLVNENMFPTVAQGVAYGLTAKAIAERAEKGDLNKLEEDATKNLAGKLYVKFMDYSNTAGKIVAVTTIVNEAFGNISSSETLTTAAISNKIKDIQENSFSEKEKMAISEVTNSINNVLESDEWKKKIKAAVDAEIVNLASKRMGAEKAKEASDFLDSLKTDLSDC